MAKKPMGLFEENVRKRWHETIPRLAGALGMPYNTLRSWLVEGRIPKPGAEALARLLGVTLDDLRKWGWEIAVTKERQHSELKINRETLEYVMTLMSAMKEEELDLQRFLTLVKLYKSKPVDDSEQDNLVSRRTC